MIGCSELYLRKVSPGISDYLLTAVLPYSTIVSSHKHATNVRALSRFKEIHALIFAGVEQKEG